MFKNTISTIPKEISSSCFFTHGQPGHQQDASECRTQRWSYDERAGSCVSSMVGSQSADLDEVFDHQRQPDFVFVDIFLKGLILKISETWKKHVSNHMKLCIYMICYVITIFLNLQFFSFSLFSLLWQCFKTPTPLMWFDTVFLLMACSHHPNYA